MRLIIAAAALSLCAGSATAVPPAPAAAPPAAAAAETPQAFMVRVVARLNATGSTWGVPRSWWDTSFAQLFADNDRLGRSSGYGLDYDSDPVCQCQDRGARFSVLGVTLRPDGRALARIRSRYAGVEEPEVSDYALVLQRTPAGWRIWDVIDEEGASTRTLLTQHNACMRRGGGADRIGACIGD